MSEWGVVNDEGLLLDGRWPTEKEALEKGLCGRYLLSGSHVIPVPEPGSDTEPVLNPHLLPGDAEPLEEKTPTRRLKRPKPTKKRKRKKRRR